MIPAVKLEYIFGIFFLGQSDNFILSDPLFAILLRFERVLTLKRRIDFQIIFIKKDPLCLLLIIVAPLISIIKDVFRLPINYAEGLRVLLEWQR